MNFHFNKRVIYILAAVAVSMIILGSKGARNLVSRKIHQLELKKELNVLKYENARLRNEIYLLENDEAHTEYLIRRDLGYIKPGEYEYRFKEQGAKK